MLSNRSPLHRSALLAATLLLGAAGMVEAASGYYRWTDDDNKVQFSQQPPDGRPYQFIQTSTGSIEESATSEAPRDAAAEEKTGDDIVSMQGLPPKDPEKCKQAQENQAVLQGNARIRAKGQDGEYRFLQPEEIEEQKQRAKEAVEVFCD